MTRKELDKLLDAFAQSIPAMQRANREPQNFWAAYRLRFDRIHEECDYEDLNHMHSRIVDIWAIHDLHEHE